MSPDDRARVEAALVLDPVGRFGGSELDGLPEPVRRYLGGAIAPDTPLARSARIEMSGHLRVGRWLPFRATEILAPHRGFVWAARAGWVVSGSDHYADGKGELDWTLAGMVRLVHAEGADVSRSAAERAAAEAVWLPTALLPRFGVTWGASDRHNIHASYSIHGRTIELRYGLDDDATVRTLAFDRWGDPDGSGEWGLHPFGGEFSSQATFGGVTIPSAGRLGWHFGTDRWPAGEFFRFRITKVTLDTGGS